jgi:cytochrome oxidase Cu insertion factor (SCO1/SenC/PrrC family)
MMMNRKIVAFVFLLLAVASSSFAQIGFNSNRIAPFQMKLHTGQPFSAAQLAKGPVVLVFFSPDCGHCQDFTKDLMKNFSVVGNKQLVMITPQSMEMLKPFVATNKLASYPNIKVGIEGPNSIVQRFYQVRTFPYIAIYDKNGNLVRTFEGEQPHQEIFKVIKSL